MMLNKDLVRSLGISQTAIEQVVIKEQEELKRRDRLDRGDRPVPDLGARTMIVVDDGIATGSTLKTLTFFNDKATEHLFREGIYPEYFNDDGLKSKYFIAPRAL